MGPVILELFYSIILCTVNEAIGINVKLERQQRHHDCVVFSYQDELAATKKELLIVTTKLSIDQQDNKMVTSDNSCVKNFEHQLKMVSILYQLKIVDKF